MPKKSDHARRERRVSATEASRSFSSLLDEVEAGKAFLVRRHGADVALLGPPYTTARPASECLALLRGRDAVHLDDEFGRDLRAVVGGEPTDVRPAWDS